MLKRDAKNRKTNNEKRVSIKTKWISPDILFTVFLMIINTIGIIFVFDTCYTSKSASFANGFMQFAFIAAGGALAYLVSMQDLRILRKISPYVILICLGMLIFVCFSGEEVNGAARWIKVGRFNIQPSEFAKVAFVLALAFIGDVTMEFRYAAWLNRHRNCFWFWFMTAALALMAVFIAKGSMSAIILYLLLTVTVAYYGGVLNAGWGRILFALFMIFAVLFYPGLRIMGKNAYNAENSKNEKMAKKMSDEADFLEIALSKHPDDRNETEKLLIQNFCRKNYTLENARDRKPEKRNDYENLIVSNYERYTEDYEKAKKKPSGERNKYEDYLIKNYNRLYFDEDLTDDGIHLKISKEEKGYISSFADDESGSGWRMQRLKAWINPKEYITGTGLQPAYSLTAISCGGFQGRGIGQGVCKFALPESHNDYIFASIAEETGFLGGFILFAVYLLLFWRGFAIMNRCENNYGRLLVCGCVSVFALQLFINIAVALNLIPSTGVCLPFISYGGSSCVANFMMAGIILAVSRQIKIPDRVISPLEKKNYRNKAISMPKKFSPFEKVKMFKN